MRSLLLLIPACLISGFLLTAQTATAPKAAAKSTAAAKSAAAAKPSALLTNYKESGSPTAPITIEAYTDYECPHCALFFKNFMPQFTADYIATGKVKFVHRDFPLPMHPHAQMAAKYANAAGEIGFYNLAVDQIFKTQDTWSINDKNTGDIDGELAKVLPPGAMQKVRELVKTDKQIDDSIAKDVNMAENVDHVPSTPTIVVVSKGKREPISSIMNMPYSIFKKYLDQKLAQ